MDDDGLVERAQVLVATRQSLVSQQRATRMRRIRDQLDEGVVDVDDDETLDRNKETARRQAKQEIPDDAQAAKLQSHVEQLRTAEAEEAELLRRLVAARKKTTEARQAVSVLVEEMGEGAPPAKKARK